MDEAPPPGPRLRVVTLNVGHGRGPGLHQALQGAARITRNLDRVGDLLKSLEPDLVALQEVDAPSSWSGRIHHVEHLAARSELPHHLLGDHARLPRWGLSYGTALLSRFPLEHGVSVRFGTNSASKGFVSAVVGGPLGATRVVSVHLHASRAGLRRRQLTRLAGFLLEQRVLPLIVAGDFNTSRRVKRSPLHAFSERLELHGPEPTPPTFPSLRPLLRLDDILVSQELLPAAAEVVARPRVSDHRPLVLELARAGRAEA